MPGIGHTLHGGKITVGDVEWLQEKLLFDRVPVQDRYIRFFVLVFLSTVIAAYGVVRNSSATVIGAMIVAPFMTPIMAVSLSSITGDSKNILRSISIVASGTALVIGLSFLLAKLLPGELHVYDNMQIMSRVAPREIDLIIALAAGAAGAFATSREDVSDALPGVAIAVSLVPPLAVVGITLAAGEISLAWDSFLLFLTNFLAIVAAGLAVFAIMGFGGVMLGKGDRKTRRLAIASVVFGTLLISVPLVIAGYNVTSTELLRRDVKNEVTEWIGDSDYGVVMIEADTGEVDIVISGEGEMPEFDDLMSGLKKKTSKKDVNVNLKVIPETTYKGRL